MLLLLPCVEGCISREGRAEQLREKAGAAVDRGDLDQAVTTLEKLLEQYPGTKAAEKATKDLVLYRGLADAVRRYPSRRAFDLMVETSRAIERYRTRNRKLPGQLLDLATGGSPGEVLDPWGRPLVYRLKDAGRGYVLTCFGADGAPGGEGADADLKVEDGEFRLKGDS